MLRVPQRQWTAGQRQAFGLRAVSVQQTEDGFEMRQQFERIEGFGEIEIGAQFQPQQLIDRFAARREHDDGNVLRQRTQAAADFVAVHLRQHHIEKDQIRRRGE